MSFDGCAALVEQADPDRFHTALLAPPERRGGLMALYAFNIEVSRAPWVTKEPMIAEMRLQWWVDAIDEIYAGKLPRSHEIVGPLAETIQTYVLPRQALDALIQARRFDIYSEPHSDEKAFENYIDATSAGLMWLAALVCANGEEVDEQRVRQVGYALGIANLLRSMSEQLAARRRPFLSTKPAYLSDLAADALTRLTSARTARRALPSSVTPALMAAWQSGAILSRITQDADAAMNGLQVSPFRKRWTLMLRSMTGRW